MKQLHRSDLLGWSRFDEARNIDFHSVLWLRPEGNVVIDPLPLTPHDEKELLERGGAVLIVVTNSDHVRDAERIAKLTGAKLAGPRGEKEAFPIRCERWLGHGDEPVPGLKVIEMHGSKTPGELALLLDGHTLVTGDLVRAHGGGALALLPDAKLSDRKAAIESVRSLLDYPDLQAVLTGDGWPVFRNGHRLLRELLASLEA
jgi:hypothetical protein